MHCDRELHTPTRPDPGSTMRAVVQSSYGPPDQLRIETLGVPQIGDTDVLVEVHAAGAGRGAWHLLTGTPLMARLGIGLRRPRRPVVGTDVAGVVVATGAKVDCFEPGDRVFGIGRGTIAELTAVPASKLASIPPNCSFAEASILAESGLTALQAVHDRAEVRPGDRVLVLGASGGVGSFAVQMSAGLGARVTGVCRSDKTSAVRAFGADEVVAYDRADITERGDRELFDVIVDAGGRHPVRRLRRILAPRGRLVIVGGEGGGRITGGFGRGFRAAALSPLVGQRLTMVVSKETSADLERLGELVADGTVRPPLERTLPLDRAADAFALLEAGEVTGKVAVVVRADPPAPHDDAGPATGQSNV